MGEEYTGPEYSMKIIECSKCGWKTSIPFLGDPAELFPLEYSKTIPTEPGYYWVKTDGMERIVSVYPNNQILVFRIFDNDDDQRCDVVDVEWAGPIKKPFSQDQDV